MLYYPKLHVFLLAACLTWQICVLLNKCKIAGDYKVSMHSDTNDKCKICREGIQITATRLNLTTLIIVYFTMVVRK